MRTDINTDILESRPSETECRSKSNVQTRCPTAVFLVCDAELFLCVYKCVFV